MPRNLDEAVKAFIARECSGRVERIRLDTTLFGDLGIDGDDADELFAAFSREFDVDLTELELSKHFGPEGLPLNPWKVFQSWLRYISRKGTPEERAGVIPITVAQLVESARSKRWLLRS